MKAVVLHEYGAPSKLQLGDMPDPRPGDGEILVRVEAVSVIPVDWKMRSGAKVKPGSIFATTLGSPSNAAPHPTVQVKPMMATPDPATIVHFAEASATASSSCPSTASFPSPTQPTPSPKTPPPANSSSPPDTRPQPPLPASRHQPGIWPQSHLAKSAAKRTLDL